MNAPTPVFSVDGLNVYPYGLMLAAGALLATLLAAWVIHARDWKGDKKPSALACALVILPCALVGARLVYCLANLPMILADLSLAFVPKLWFGGFSFAGAVLFGILGAYAYAKATGVPFRAVADALAPSAGLVILLARLGEYFTDQGLGHYVLNSQWQFFPLAVQNAFGEYQLPVFLYEALAGLVVMVLGLAFQKGSVTGGAAEEGLLFLCISQILLESLREDDFIRFGFVRFNQLFAALGVAALLILYLVRRKRALGQAAGIAGRIFGFAVCVAVVIGVEFALDKSAINNGILYGVMGVALFLLYMLTATAKTGRNTKKNMIA